jgi:hypothetical protein
MTTNSNAQLCEETPHATNSTSNKPISDAIKRRAKSLIKDRTIDAGERVIIRYALEINDPCLPGLVRRADAGESFIDNLAALEDEAADDNEHEEKIEALADVICRAGDEPEIKSAALLVLLSTIENSEHPKAVANTAKHITFSRCGESNCYGMVDAQIASIESKLLASIVET